MRKLDARESLSVWLIAAKKARATCINLVKFDLLIQQYEERYEAMCR
jgi:hypothetical protein